MTSSGNVVLAGPNRRIDILALLEQLADLSIDVTFLDGALNRLAAMTSADGLILSTGAAFDSRIPVIARHAQAMESLFHYPKYAADAGLEQRGKVSWSDGKEAARSLPFGSVLDEHMLATLTDWMRVAGEGVCIVPGIFNPGLFQKGVAALEQFLAGKQFVFASPLNLLTTGQPEVWQESFSALKKKGAGVAYLHPVHLNFMTVNPFFPRYLQKTASYVADFVDKMQLLQAVKESVRESVVVDILQPPHPDLLDLCHLN